jgi:hypothetical protein
MKKVFSKYIIFLIVLILLYQHETIISYFDLINLPANELMCNNVPFKIKSKLLNNNNNLTIISRRNNEYNKVAIIIPYRNRIKNLNLFLTYMHQFLSSQQQNNISYGIYLVEPIKSIQFNKALSMNIGFIEVNKQLLDSCNCFIFHDIDILPENELISYKCNNKMPKQMATSISRFNYSTDGYFKNKYFGGANAFTREQFMKINGFSNLYFDWGLEDDDFRMRVLNKYPIIERLPPHLGRYFANCHPQQKRNPNRYIQN